MLNYITAPTIKEEREETVKAEHQNSSSSTSKRMQDHHPTEEDDEMMDEDEVEVSLDKESVLAEMEDDSERGIKRVDESNILHSHLVTSTPQQPSEFNNISAINQSSSSINQMSLSGNSTSDQEGFLVAEQKAVPGR